MKRSMLTGTPGSGKTSILHALKSQGYGVVEEAATEVIAREQRRGNLEPHLRPDFIDAIVRLQKHRQLEAAMAPFAKNCSCSSCGASSSHHGIDKVYS
jgi:predicted ATPase